MKELYNVRANVDYLLNVSTIEQNRDKTRQ